MLVGREGIAPLILAPEFFSLGGPRKSHVVHETWNDHPTCVCSLHGVIAWSPKAGRPIHEPYAQWKTSYG